MLHALVGYCIDDITSPVVRLVLESYSIEDNKIVLETEVSLTREDGEYYLLLDVDNNKYFD